jgi:hypothetical protein
MRTLRRPGVAIPFEDRGGDVDHERGESGDAEPMRDGGQPDARAPGDPIPETRPVPARGFEPEQTAQPERQHQVIRAKPADGLAVCEILGRVRDERTQGDRRWNRKQDGEVLEEREATRRRRGEHEQIRGQEQPGRCQPQGQPRRNQQADDPVLRRRVLVHEGDVVVGKAELSMVLVRIDRRVEGWIVEARGIGQREQRQQHVGDSERRGDPKQPPFCRRRRRWRHYLARQLTK